MFANLVLTNELELASDVCFICLDDNNTIMRHGCSCTSRVHKECLLKMVNMNGNNICKVCLNEIRWLTVSRSRSCKPLLLLLIVVYIISFLSLFLIGWGYFESTKDDYYWYNPYAIPLGTMIVLCTAFINFLICKRYDGQCMLVQNTFTDFSPPPYRPDSL